MEEIYVSWKKLKELENKKKLLCQYKESDEEYYVYIVEAGIKYYTIIDKGDEETGKTEEQIDFESNHLNHCNRSIEPHADDGKLVVKSESRPFGCTTVFLGRADSDNNIGDGKCLFWDFSNDEDLVEAPKGYKRKRLEFKFLDSVYVKDGKLYFFNAKKGSYIDFKIVCPAGQYYYDNEGKLHKATEDTVISWYVRNLFFQDSCPMGDMLNSESCSSEIPNYYKFIIEVTVPDTDNESNGYVELEIYRKRTIVL